MAALTVIRSRPRVTPDGRKLIVVASFNAGDTSGTLQVEKGNIVRVMGVSVGVPNPGIAGCSDTPGDKGMISPTSSAALTYINVVRSEAAAATKYSFVIDYDSSGH